jgi:hypothetical protein
MMTTPQHRKSTTTPGAGEVGWVHLRSVPNIEPESEMAQETERPFGDGARDEIDADLRHRMISEAAYHLYAQRGYADGYEVDDWQQAEADVAHLLLEPRSAPGG